MCGFVVHQFRSTTTITLPEISHCQRYLMSKVYNYRSGL